MNGVNGGQARGGPTGSSRDACKAPRNAEAVGEQSWLTQFSIAPRGAKDEWDFSLSQALARCAETLEYELPFMPDRIESNY